MESNQVGVAHWSSVSCRTLRKDYFLMANWSWALCPLMIVSNVKLNVVVIKAWLWKEGGVYVCVRVCEYLKNVSY